MQKSLYTWNEIKRNINVGFFGEKPLFLAICNISFGKLLLCKPFLMRTCWRKYTTSSGKIIESSII